MTVTTVVPPQRCLDVLAEQGLLPDRLHAVYLAGSLVRGWGNPLSDLDVYVIVDEPWTRSDAEVGSVSVRPGFVPIHGFVSDGRRWDVEYWSEQQVDDLLALVSWPSFESRRGRAESLTTHEVAFMQRLAFAKVISGAEWVRRRTNEFATSAVRTMIASRALYEFDLFAEDAVGMLEAGDTDSAVLAARYGFDHVVEALLASHGEFNEQAKWRARRMRAVSPPELSFEDYWALETMRDLDPDSPDDWVKTVLRVCQDIANEVKLG
jgi:hypothetical protein